MSALLHACLDCLDWPAFPSRPVKRVLKRGPAMRVFVVLTPSRVFTFTALHRAETFQRRAARCPSLKGVSVELVVTTTNGSLRWMRE